MKKILLDPTNKSENQKIIREIKTLSRLSHQGIVRYVVRGWLGWEGGDRSGWDDRDDRLVAPPLASRYYHAWVESEGDSAMWPGDGTLEGTLTEMENSLHQDLSSSSSDTSSRGGLGWDLAPSAADTGRRRTISASDSEGGGGGLGGGGGGSDGEEDWDELESCSDASSIDLSNPLDDTLSHVRTHQTSGSVSAASGAKPKLQCYLYIQMEYCDTTLRALIDRGNLHSNLEEVWRILRQIVDALAYIHSSGVIHR